MSRLKSVSLLSFLVVLFCVTSVASAQDTAALLGAVPAAQAQPLLTAKAIQDDAAHSVAIHMREIPTGNAKDLGRAPAEMHMELVLELQRPAAQEKALADFVRQTDSPGSALYGKTLSPAEFAQQFGLAASDLDTVKNWLTAKGFEVTTIDNGRLTIQFKGDDAQVEDAFHTEIHQYQGADGTQHFANATELRIPRQLSRVIDTIEGAQNFTAMERRNFDGPVTDFALGTELENKVSVDANATPLPVHLTGDALHDASFTASKVTMDLKDGLTTLNVRLGGDSHPATGSLTISSEEHGTIAVIRDITVCEGYNSGYGRSCTVDFKPSTGGVYTLHALYSGDDQTRASEQKLAIHANVGTNVTYQVETVSPITYYNYSGVTVQGGTLTWNISWAAPYTQVQPTGSVVFSLKSGNALGTLTLPAAGQTTSSGSCTAYAGTCSYACSYTAAQEIISCTLTDTAMSSIVSASSAGFKYTATYSGDTNYAIGTAATTEGYIAIDNATLTATLTASPTINASTYGTATTEPSFNATFTPTSGTVVNYEGSSSGPFFEMIGSAQLGTVVNNDTISAACTTACAIPSWTVPAVVTPGTYPLTLAFSGTGASTSGSYTSWYKEVISSSTLNLVVNPATATLAMATPTAGFPTSQVYGSTTPFSVTATLTWPGSGAPPNPADVIFSSTAAGTFGATSCGTTSPTTCTATFTPAGTSAVGSYNFSVYFAGSTSTGVTGYDVNYKTTTASTITGDYTITQATTTLALSSTGPGTTTTGVTTAPVTATTNVNASGITVTFTDATTSTVLGTATTNSSGVATFNVTTATTGVAAGLNNITASITGTGNYTSATATAYPVYLQGILFSVVGPHDFSGLIADGSLTVEGTLDGTTAAAFGIGVYNFTTSSQTLPVTLTNSSSKAFTLANQCGTTLSAGELCTLSFNYAPPYGDGCTAGTGGTCTNDGSGYQQGTFESATWTYTLASGTIAGRGNAGFTTSGVVATTGTLEGKAIQAPETLTVSPTTASFGNVTQGSTSSTITIVVTNPNAQPVAFTYAGPTTSNFTVNNSCSSPIAASASCSIYVSLVTSSTGTFSDSFTITPSGGTVSTVSLSGGVAASTTGITLTSTGHNFGNITDGTSTSFGITLTNHTASSASLAFTNTAGTGFTASTGCGSALAAGASCNYTFTFAPTAPGAATDSLVVSSNVPLLPGSTGSGSSYSDTVTVTGSGVTGGQFTATSVKHNFGSLAAGTSGGNYGVELVNNTAASVSLNFSGLTNTADGFSLVGSSCGATLAVNGNCELLFTFTPATSGLGTVSAVYPITANATLYSGGTAVSPAQITLVGTGQ